MRLVAWQPDDLVRRLDDVVSVYGEAMGYRTELLQTRRGYIGAHVRRAGFRAVATLTTDDNRISFGCINLPVSFYEDVLSPTVRQYGAIIYVLPEVKTPQQVFGAYDVTDPAQVAAAQAQQVAQAQAANLQKVSLQPAR